MYESVSGFRAGETASFCVTARIVGIQSQIQLPLCYRYWWRTSLIESVRIHS